MSKDIQVSKPNLFVSSNVISKHLDSKHIVLLMIFKESMFSGLECLELPAEVTNLLKQFEDIFPLIYHQIYRPYLVPGAALL